MIKVCGGLRPKEGTASNAVVSLVAHKLGGVTQSRDAPLPKNCDLYVQHGWKLTPALQEAMDSLIPYIALDSGYFDPRGSTFSISINGFHGLSMPVDVTGLPERPKPELQPWRAGGEFVYVFGQLTGDRAVRGQNMETWPNITARQAAEAYGLPVRIRPHPFTISSWEEPLPPLSKVWPECAVAVTWTSSVGVQAIVAGVPSVALHPASPICVVAAPSFGIERPDREAWQHELSYRQYGFTELDAAKAYILHAYEPPADAASRDEYDRAGLRV